MLENDAELRELANNLAKVRDETLLGVENARTLAGKKGQKRVKRARRKGTHIAVHITRHLAVQVENHILLFHLGKDLVVDPIPLHPDAALRVGRHAARVALDAHNAALLGFDDMRRGERAGEVERGEDVQGGSDGLELFGVGDGLRGEGERRDEVGLRGGAGQM